MQSLESETRVRAAERSRSCVVALPRSLLAQLTQLVLTL